MDTGIVADCTPQLDEAGVTSWLEPETVEVELPEVLVTGAMIDAERDRRIDGGIAFAGVRFQTREKDRENIMGAFSLAAAWIMTGGSPISLRWHGGPNDFEWIAEDNTTLPMSAATVLAFGKAVANEKSRLIFIARALKDELPGDFANDGYWQ